MPAAPASYLAVEETSPDRRVRVRLEERRAPARSRSLVLMLGTLGVTFSHQECIKDGVLMPSINKTWGMGC